MRRLLILFLLAFPIGPALADDFDDTIKVFRKAGESSQFFGREIGRASCRERV